MNTKLHSPPNISQNFKQSLAQIRKVCLHSPIEGIEMIKAFYSDCKNNIDALSEAEIWTVMGVGHLVGKDYMLSLIFFKKSLQVFEKHTATKNIIGTQNWMALSYKAIENPEKALILLFSSLQLSQQHGFKFLEYRTTTCLGGVYQSIYNGKKAAEYLEKALLLSPQDDRAIALSNLASIYANLENHKKALTYLEEAYSLKYTSGILMNRAYITVNLVITLGELRQYDSILPKLKELDEMAKGLKDTSFLRLYHNCVIGLYLRCKESTLNPVISELMLHIDIEATVNYLEEEIRSSETQNLSPQLNACALLVAYYVLDKNWKQIAFCQKKLIDLNALKFEKEKMEAIERLHIKYEVAQKEQKIKIQELKLEKKEVELNRKKELEKTNLQLEEKVAKRTAKLTLQNQQLREFAFIVSHDLREPLCNIHGITDLLITNYQEKMDEELQVFISQIGSSAQHMNRLLKDLLDYTTLEKKIEKEGFQKVNSMKVLQKVCNSLKTEAIDTHIGFEKLPILHSSQYAIEVLFHQILSNALKFRHPDKACKIKFSCIETASGYQFSISDNGIGIDKNQYDVIFRVFQQLNKQSHQGTGIGLAICKKAIQILEGTILVESELGKGSTFYFTIPKLPKPTL